MTTYRKTGHPARNGKMKRMAAALAAAAFLMSGTVSFADLTGTVTEQSVKIRQEASSTSEVVGGKVYGDTITITNEVTDSTGTLWYEVQDGNTKGYIRADLVSKAGSESTPTDTSAETGGDTASNETGGGIEGPETPLDAQYATVSVPAAKVRTEPSKESGMVESLAKDAQVVISGQSVGRDGEGKTWYYVTFTTNNGAQKTGYIRSDLVTPGELLPVEEPQPEETQPEEPQPEETQPEETPLYEVKYTQSQDGEEYAWYLIDNTPKLEGGNATQQKVEDILTAAHANGTIIADNAKTISMQRIVIIIMGVVLVALIVTVVIMIIKLRDAYYEDYEDDEDEDEDEEEEEEETPRRRRSRDSEEETPRRRRETEEETPRRRREAEEETPRRRRVAEEETPRRRRPAEEETPRRRRETEEETPRRRRPSEEEAPRRRRETEGDSGRARTAQRSERRQVMQEIDRDEDVDARASSKQSAKRKSKNFLLDDDEFEFEFLSMDDKDLK